MLLQADVQDGKEWSGLAGKLSPMTVMGLALQGSYHCSAC